MATYANIPVLVPGPGNSGTISNGSAVASAILIGSRNIFAINATQDMNIRFGNAANTTADATDFRIPQNQTFTFDMGNESQYISLYNNSGSSLTYFWNYLSKF